MVGIVWSALLAQIAGPPALSNLSAEALVKSYYSTRHPRPAETVYHAIKVMPATVYRGQPADLVCVSFTMTLRWGMGHADTTEAFFLEPETKRILRVDSENEGLNVCARAALLD